jgi:hypothetical protein
VRTSETYALEEGTRCIADLVTPSLLGRGFVRSSGSGSFSAADSSTPEAHGEGKNECKATSSARWSSTTNDFTKCWFGFLYFCSVPHLPEELEPKQSR